MLKLRLSDIYCGPYEKMLLKHLLYDYERQNRFDNKTVKYNDKNNKWLKAHAVYFQHNKTGVFSDNKSFLATLVALDFTLVSKWVGRSVVVSN